MKYYNFAIISIFKTVILDFNIVKVTGYTNEKDCIIWNMLVQEPNLK